MCALSEHTNTTLGETKILTWQSLYKPSSFWQNFLPRSSLGMCSPQNVFYFSSLVSINVTRSSISLRDLTIFNLFLQARVAVPGAMWLHEIASFPGKKKVTSTSCSCKKKKKLKFLGLRQFKHRNSKERENQSVLVLKIDSFPIPSAFFDWNRDFQFSGVGCTAPVQQKWVTTAVGLWSEQERH